jgi:phosphoglycerate dehydrogenase-like enzyme
MHLLLPVLHLHLHTVLTLLTKNSNTMLGSSGNLFLRFASKKSVGRILSVATSNAGFHCSPSLAAKVPKEPKSWADPAMRQYKFWNRDDESFEKGKYSYLLEISPESIQREARILSLSSPDDKENSALHEGNLPMGAQFLGVGQSVEDFEAFRDSNPTTLFVSPSCPHARVQLPLVLAAFPSIEWVHVRSAGIDFLVSDALAQFHGKLHFTNAKGQFSSSLAEYVMMACSYFAKDLPKLMKNQSNKHWDSYDIEELRGKTLGIVGYGDVGRACAKLASVYGMKIVALRRHPYLSRDDPYCDYVYGRDKESLNQLMSESDYIVCSAPSTVETRGMVNADAFEHVKQDAVLINLGRGPVIDENALAKALKSRKLKGAALDVFSQEPLPADNELWDFDNVLISPHNMDKTETFSKSPLLTLLLHHSTKLTITIRLILL